MNKFISGVIAATLALSTLTACGSANTSDVAITGDSEVQAQADASDSAEQPTNAA